MLKDQPFRIDGDKAYGLGIADDKQGVALILHTVAMLQEARLQGLRHAHGADQRRRGDQLARLAQHHHQVRRRPGRGVLVRGRRHRRQAAAGDQRHRLGVSHGQGKSSHAGARPEGGVNALYELSHQVLQMKDLSRADQGLKLNWTVSQGRHQPQRDPGRGDGPGRCARARGRRFRPAAEARCRSEIKQQLLPTPRSS